MEKPSQETKQIYDDLVSNLGHEAPVVASQMFGMPTAKVNGKAVFGIFGDAMVFKLPLPSVEEALRTPNATLFDPMGGRPMKQWVQIPLSENGEWEKLARLSLGL